MNLDLFFLSVLGWFFFTMTFTYSAELYCCLFYFNNDRLEDSRTVQEYLWQIQCQPSSPVTNTLYCITILLCAVHKPTSFVLPDFPDVLSLKQTTVLRFSAIFADWNVLMDLPLAYRRVVSPGSKTRSRHFTVALCIIPSCSWIAISSRQEHLGYKQESYIFIVLMAVVTLIQSTRRCFVLRHWPFFTFNLGLGGLLSSWLITGPGDMRQSVGSQSGFIHILVYSSPLLAAHTPKKSRALF